MLSAVVLAGCSGEASDASAGDASEEIETITLTYADYAQEASDVSIRAFAEEVAEQSDGNITIETYFAGSLLSVEDMLPGVSSGVADIGNVPVTYFAQEMPITDWMMGLTTATSESFPLQSLESATATIETVLSSPDLQAEAEANGVKVLYATANDPRYDMICNEELTSLDSFRGALASANGDIWVGEADSIGMTPTSVPPAEQYEGLERGVMDCAIVSPISPMDYGLWEISNYYHNLQFAGFNAGRTIINSSTWDSLSDGAKQIIWDALPLIAIEKTRHNIEQYARLATEGPEEQNLEFVDPDEAVIDTLRQYQNEELENLANQAPDSLTDPQAFIDEYLGSVEEYGTSFIESMDLDPQAPDDRVAAHVEATELDLSLYEEAIRDIYAANSDF